MAAPGFWCFIGLCKGGLHKANLLWHHTSQNFQNLESVFYHTHKASDLNPEMSQIKAFFLGGSGFAGWISDPMFLGLNQELLMEFSSTQVGHQGIDPGQTQFSAPAPIQPKPGNCAAN